MMRQNVRRPDMLWGDLQAQLASLAMGESNIEQARGALRRARRFDAGLRANPRFLGGAPCGR